MTTEQMLKTKITQFKFVYSGVLVEQSRLMKARRKLNRHIHNNGTSVWARRALKANNQAQRNCTRKAFYLGVEIKLIGDTICRLREIKRGRSKRTVESVLLQYAMKGAK